MAKDMTRMLIRCSNSWIMTSISDFHNDSQCFGCQSDGEGHDSDISRIGLTLKFCPSVYPSRILVGCASDATRILVL
jgi:hypothetical protein